MFLNTHIIAIN